MKKILGLFSLFAILIVLAGCAATPLFDATIRGDIKEVTAILDRGADINDQSSNMGWNPLLSAASTGNTEMVKVLLDRGADINSRTNFAYFRNWTPLMHAAYNGHANTVKLLLERGADIEIKSKENLIESYNKNALQMAEERGQSLITRMIRETQEEHNYNARQKERTLQAQKQYITDNPTDSRGFVRLSYLYSEAQQYDEAITAAKRAIELKPDNYSAYSNLGRVYGMKKQYDEAIKALKKSIEINPKDSTDYDLMGHFLMEQNAYNEAIEAYKKAVELQPANINYLINLANIYKLMGKYDDAIASVNKAIELQTFTYPAIEISIEDGYPAVKVTRGHAKKADILAGDKIIKIDGKSPKGWNLKQVIQSLRGTSGTQVVLTIERKGAEKTIDKTVTGETVITKEAALSFGLRSLAYRYKGSLEAALTDAEKAYSLDSENGWAQLSLGASYLDGGKYDESIKLLSQTKVSLIARILEATAYAKQGKTKLAVNIYFSIPEEEMSPKNIPLMNDRMALLQTFKPIVKEHRDKARSFESKGQYQEALAELSEALKIADDTEAQAIQETTFSMLRRNPLLAEMPEDARKYALRSEVLLKEGNLEQAATELKKAIRIAPYAPRLYYSSALINAELKRYPEAIRHMKIYLKAVPDAPDARAVKDEMIKWEFMMEKGNK